MGVVIFFIVIAVFVVWANVKSENTETKTPPRPPGISPQKFEIRAQKTTKTIGGASVPMLSIGARGPMFAPVRNYPTRIRCEILDTTDKDPMPILVTIEALQAKGSLMFLYEDAGPTLPHKQSILENWSEWLALPYEFFEFPRNGLRRLKITLSVLDGLGVTTLASATTFTSLTISEKGYMQRREERMKAKQLSLRLAMAVSAADGDLASEESDLIKKWVRARTRAADGTHNDDEVDALNQSIREAYHDIVEGDGIGLFPLCHELSETASMAEKYDALELCVRIVGADDVAQTEEMDLLHSVADWLGLKNEKLRGFVDKHLPVNIQSVDNILRVLGLREDMTVAEKKKALREAYRHWNSMVAHADSKVRKQAEEMLSLIAAERAKLNRSE